jgi:polyphosphate kinase 2 (PPK2 family)
MMAKFRVSATKPLQLSAIATDDDLGWDKSSQKGELEKVVGEMAFEQHRLMAEAKQSLLIVLQGRDASGKDGLVRHVMTGMNPAGVRVTSFKVPAGIEKQHDYLWRCHDSCPARGEVGVWNRSHYEDILVPRVKNLVGEEVWKKRYRHIRDFEQMLVDEEYSNFICMSRMTFSGKDCKSGSIIRSGVGSMIPAIFPTERSGQSMRRPMKMYCVRPRAHMPRGMSSLLT